MSTDPVFGVPIIEGSRSQRAAKAANDRNAGEKRDKAVSFVKKNINEDKRLGTTLCIFYNATGLPLKYHVGEGKDYLGKVKDDGQQPPDPPNPPNQPIAKGYPEKVENGQWGAFLHEEDNNLDSGSKAYVIYHVGEGDTNECIGLMGWKTPHNEPNDIHALCDVYEPGYKFDDEQISTAIDQGSKKTKSTNSSNFVKLISMTASIRTTSIQTKTGTGTETRIGTAPLFEAIFENA